MADKTMNVRLLLKYDSFTNWSTNNPVLKAGEMAIAYIESGDTQEVNAIAAPQTLAKVGNGTSHYNDLPFLSAKAANVHQWALAATKPEYQASEIQGLDSFIAGEIQDTDTQYKIVKVTDYQYKLMSKAIGEAEFTTEVAVIDIPNDTTAITANANAIAALQALVGDTNVGVQIQNAITALNLANTYDAKGAATQALTDAKAYTDTKDTAMDTRVKALEDMFGDGEGTVEAQIEAAVATETAAREQAIAGVQDEVDALEQTHATDKAALEASIATAKAAGDNAQTYAEGVAADLAQEVTDRTNAVKGVQDAVDAIEADYLKAADKTELDGKITTNADAISALEAKMGDKSVSEQINAITDPIDGRVAAIEADYLKAADKTELANATTAVSDRVATLEGTITGLSGAMHFEGVKDALPEDVSAYEAGDVIIVGNKEYVFNDGAFVEFGDVSAEGERITALENHKTTYEAKVATLETEMDAVEGRATDLETAVATKAAQADLEAAVGRIGTAEGEIDAIQAEIVLKATKEEHNALAEKVTAAEGEIDTLQTDLGTAEVAIDALEGLVGETAVATQIQNAIDALKIGDYAKAADLTAAVARVAQNETDIDALEGRMDTTEGDIDALETEVAKKANDAELAAVAKSGLIDDLSLGEGTVLIFDCGNSQV